jgi:hypothetical protein
MTDKDFKRVSKLLKQLQKKWLASLGFNRWTVKVSLYRTEKEGATNCSAECIVAWEYQDMWLKFYGPVLAEKTDKQLEETFVHECLHGLVNETRMWAKDLNPNEVQEGMHHEERVVTGLAQAILWARYDGLQEGKRRKK